MSYILSKSAYIKGLQCIKALYLYKHHYYLKDPISNEQQAIFNRGHHVGKLAHQLFPGGVDVSPPSPKQYKQAIQKTQELIKSGFSVIYEAALVGLNTLVYADILVKNENQYDLYEVKSSLKLSKTYYQDAALQYAVAKASGLPINKVYLVNINSEYMLEDTLQVQKFFKINDVTEYCVTEEENVAKKIASLIEVLQQSKAPKVEIGLHCNSPYPCDFKGTCWKNVNPAAVIYLNGVEQEQLTKWSEEGIHLVSDIKNTDGIKDNIRLQLEAIQKGEPIINKEKIKAFVASLKFPLTFFDIEAAMPAVPRFVGTGPYHSLPGIFSFVTLNEKGQQKDFCWMHEGHSDPREPFIKAFIEQIPHEGDLLVYDALSEQNILKKLISDFPKYEASLKAITERIKDLALPFAERWYYHPEFRGGYSLKLVSRILFKDNLYAHTAIASGAEAMIVYENLAQTNHLFEYAQMLENLKEYSLADVKMLVEIFHFFRSI